MFCITTYNTRTDTAGHTYARAELIADTAPASMPTTGEGIDGMADWLILDEGTRLSILDDGGSEWILGQDGSWYEQEDGGCGPSGPYETPEEVYERVMYGYPRIPDPTDEGEMYLLFDRTGVEYGVEEIIIDPGYAVVRFSVYVDTGHMQGGDLAVDYSEEYAISYTDGQKVTIPIMPSDTIGSLIAARIRFVGAGTGGVSGWNAVKSIQMRTASLIESKVRGGDHDANHAMPLIFGRNARTSSVNDCLKAITLWGEFQNANLGTSSAPVTFASYLPSLSVIRTDESSPAKFKGSLGSLFLGSGISAISAIDMSGMTTADGVFKECYALRSVPFLNFGAATSFQNTFLSCYSLEKIGGEKGISIDSSASTKMYQTFYNCTSLKRLELPLDKIGSSLNVARSILTGCTALRSLVITGLGSTTSLSALEINGSSTNRKPMHELRILDASFWQGNGIYISYCSFTEGGIKRLFEDLPSITNGSTITITGNPGADGIHASTLKIATDKGWTITGATNVVDDIPKAITIQNGDEFYVDSGWETGEPTYYPIEAGEQAVIHVEGGTVPASLADIPILLYAGSGTYELAEYQTDYLFYVPDTYEEIQPGQPISGDITIQPMGFQG